MLYGGAINTGGQVLIVNSTFTGNQADSDDDTFGSGGALYVTGNTPELHNTIVAGNTAGSTTSDVSDTGGTGTLGRLVVRRLQEANRDVRVLSRRSQKAEDGVRYVAGDLATGKGS